MSARQCLDTEESISWQYMSMQRFRGLQAKGFSSCGEEGGAWRQVSLLFLRMSMHFAINPRLKEAPCITDFSANFLTHHIAVYDFLQLSRVRAKDYVAETSASDRECDGQRSD